MFVGKLDGELYYSAHAPDGQKLVSTDGFTVSERANLPDGAAARQMGDALCDARTGSRTRKRSAMDARRFGISCLMSFAS